MATVQTLNDKDGNTLYPVTKIEAVYNDDGSKTLDYILDHTIIASTDPADANKVFKADASLGLVGSNNIDFTTSSVSITPASNITFAPASSIVKFGKIVVANLMFTSSSSIPTSGITIGTLPGGSRPLGTLTNTGWSYPNYTARCFVDTDGAVNFNPEVSVSANTNCGVSFVFIAS